MATVILGLKLFVITSNTKSESTSYLSLYDELSTKIQHITYMQDENQATINSLFIHQ